MINKNMRMGFESTLASGGRRSYVHMTGTFEHIILLPSNRPLTSIYIASESSLTHCISPMAVGNHSVLSLTMLDIVPQLALEVTVVSGTARLS